MKVMLDTSVLVPAMVALHPRHSRAAPWLRKARAGKAQLVVAAHSLAETYAVLSAMPTRPRLTPAITRQMIRANIEPFAEVVALRPADYRRVLDDVASLGLAGGVVYDALAGRVAQKAKVDALLTFNTRDFLRVWPEGADVIQEP